MHDITIPNMSLDPTLRKTLALLQTKHLPMPRVLISQRFQLRANYILPLKEDPSAMHEDSIPID